MKKKEREEVKLKTIAELRRLLSESRDLLFKLKLDKSQNKLKNQRQIFWERKRVALFLTLINEKDAEELEKKKIEVGKRGKA